MPCAKRSARPVLGDRHMDTMLNYYDILHYDNNVLLCANRKKNVSYLMLFYNS